MEESKKNLDLGWEHPVRRLFVLQHEDETKTEFYNRIGVSRFDISRKRVRTNPEISSVIWKKIFENAKVTNPLLQNWLLLGNEEPTTNLWRVIKRYHGLGKIGETDYRYFTHRLLYFKLPTDNIQAFLIRINIDQNLFNRWTFSRFTEIFPSQCRRILEYLKVDYRSPLGEWLMFTSKKPPPEQSKTCT